MAPEIYNANEMPCKALPTDVFSLGVLFFMMAFGAPPFQSAEFSDGYFSYLKLRPGNTDFFKFHPHTRQLYGRGQIPVSFMNMILSMLMADPNQRVQEVSQLKSFEFFKDSEVSLHRPMGAAELVQHIEIMA
jgi:serine/threonine protein kinase